MRDMPRNGEMKEVSQMKQATKRSKNPGLRLSQLGTPGFPGPFSGHWLPLMQKQCQPGTILYVDPRIYGSLPSAPKLIERLGVPTSQTQASSVVRVFRASTAEATKGGKNLRRQAGLTYRVWHRHIFQSQAG